MLLDVAPGGLHPFRRACDELATAMEGKGKFSRPIASMALNIVLECGGLNEATIVAQGEVPMTNRRVVFVTIIALIMLSVFFAYAGPKDFWVMKPYTEWNAKEVEKILLKDSPWTQTLLPLAASGSVDIGSTSKGGGSGGGGNLPPKIIINWYSRPIREAIVRQMMLNAPNASKEAMDRILNHKSQFIELLVTGVSMGGGRGGGGAEIMERFKTETFLQKKNNEKIPLANLIPARGRDGATTLQFPQDINGKSAITAEDKEVTLVMRIGENNHKFKFKLADMMINDKLEIQ